MGLMQSPAGAPAEKDPSRYTDEEDSNVSPEEQAAYEQAVENAAQLMFDVKTNKVRPEILQSLTAEKTEAPVDENGEQGQAQPPHIMALANTAVTLVEKLDDSAREAKQPLSDDVLMELGQTVVEMLVEHAEAEGIQEYSQDDIDGAFITAADMYRAKAIADGRTDEETLKGQWDELITADQQGRLGEVLPGADQAPPEQEV